MITEKLIDYESPSIEVAGLLEPKELVCTSGSGSTENYSNEDEFNW